MESNFNGERFATGDVARLIEEARRRKVFVCLDAAKYVSTHPLDLSQINADFICVSFYKIFGYPTGLGALIAKKNAMNILDPTRRGYFGGGSLVFLSKNYHSLKTQLPQSQDTNTTANGDTNNNVVTNTDGLIYHRDAFVNGTTHYQGIASLCVNFEMF